MDSNISIKHYQMERTYKRYAFLDTFLAAFYIYHGEGQNLALEASTLSIQAIPGTRTLTRPQLAWMKSSARLTCTYCDRRDGMKRHCYFPCRRNATARVYYYNIAKVGCWMCALTPGSPHNPSAPPRKLPMLPTDCRSTTSTTAFAVLRHSLPYPTSITMNISVH